MPGAGGIRLSKGRGWPLDPTHWSLPGSPIITGTEPGGCIDRRPLYTGYPAVVACEFDGRLSVVQHEGAFRLYARANLRFGAVTGGRYVQTTMSSSLEHGWRPWQQVRIAGIDPALVDIYFFAVQVNPVDHGSLLAIFPLMQPPLACIMIAFSTDGVSFSRPINLRGAKLGVRTEGTAGRWGRLEWRSEDHPVAGVVRTPDEPATLLFYVHHAVRGTTLRERARPLVRAYRLAAEDVHRWTREARYD